MGLLYYKTISGINHTFATRHINKNIMSCIIIYSARGRHTSIKPQRRRRTRH